MEATGNHRKKTRAGYYSLLLISVILILVGVFLYGYLEKSHKDFVASQQALMKQSTQGTAQLISLFIEETRQRVRLFAEEESGLLSTLASNPDDDERMTQLVEKLRRYFPDFFAYTIAADDGNVLLNDFDGKVEAVCQTDIKAFAERHDYHGVFIHPNPGGYHFDIMVRWQGRDGSSGIFFVSFPPTLLARILTNNQLHNHQLLLLHQDRPGLIEVTAAGSRIELQREFLLSPEEQARIGFTTEVAGSRWSLADLPAADLFVKQRNTLFTHVFSVFLVFLLFSSLMYWLIAKNEKALRRSEERFALVIRGTNDGIWDFSIKTGKIYFSPRWKEMLGYQEHEIADNFRAWQDLIHPDYLWQLLDAWLTCIEKVTDIFSFEYRIKTKQGDWKWVACRGLVVLDDEGTPVRFAGSQTDITKRKHAEQELNAYHGRLEEMVTERTAELGRSNADLKQLTNALRASEEQLRLTFENAPIGIATVAPDGSLLEANPAFCKTLGYSTEEVQQMSVADFTHPDDREFILGVYRKIWAGEADTQECEKRCIRQDGTIIDAYVHIGVIRNADGKPLLFVAEFEDITERKRVTQEVQHMRAYLQNVVDSMPSILVGVDAEAQVTEWNNGAEQATGLSSAEAIGRGFAEVLPEYRSQMANFQEAIRSRQPVRADRLITETEGQSRYADVVVYPLVANGILGAVIRIDDITDRVRLEEMMVQTEKMMSVGGLAAGMAHEINNPLSGVLQSCQNIQRRLSPDLLANRQMAESLGIDMTVLQRYLQERGILKFVEGIQEAAGRASGIVADMLAFSRRSGIPMSPVRVDDMLDRVVRLAASDYDLKKKYDFRQIEIIRDLDPQLGEVKCERMEIEQVLLNLIKNAAHAMSDAETPQPQIILRTRLEANQARIEVQDNGPGIDEETQRRIFEPFFTTKGVDEGTGLGLSVSYFIITEQHKGSIAVFSSPGNGACFVVRLPLEGK